MNLLLGCSASQAYSKEGWFPLQSHTTQSQLNSLTMLETTWISSTVPQERLHHKLKLDIARRLFFKVQAWQGRVTRNWKDEVSTIPCTGAIWVRVINSGKMLFVGGARERLNTRTSVAEPPVLSLGPNNLVFPWFFSSMAPVF